MTKLEMFLYVIGAGLAICALLGLGILILYLNAPDRQGQRAGQPKGRREPMESFRMGAE